MGVVIGHIILKYFNFPNMVSKHYFIHVMRNEKIEIVNFKLIQNKENNKILKMWHDILQE
jgi:hypothetical protein